MITITDQILLSLCLPLDTRLSNLIVDGGNVIVETKEQYLSRVDLNCRFLGMQVTFLSPAAIYPINEFLNKSQSGEIIKTSYEFVVSISDDGFILNNSSIVITVNDKDSFDSTKVGGYKSGDIVSYVNLLSSDPFNEEALYVATSDIPNINGVPSPEESNIWLWQGQEMIIPSGTTANGSVSTISQLRSITNIRNGDTIDVLGSSSKYRFYSDYEGGIKPYNEEVGSWTAICFIQPVLRLSAVLTKENDGDNIVMSRFSKVVVYEVDPNSQSLSFNVEDESFNETISITVTEPSIVTKTGIGYNLEDFTIVPFDLYSTTEDIISFGVGVVGAVNPNDVIPKGSSLTSALKQILQKKIPLVYPIAGLNSSPSSTQEVGATISFVLTPTFNQNDGGMLTNVVFKRSTTIIRTQSNLTSYTDSNRIVQAGNNIYNIEISYSAGSTNPQKDGFVPAGMTTAQVNIPGTYKNWYGSYSGSTPPFNGSDIRNLSYSYSNSFTLNTWTDDIFLLISIPSTKSLVSVIDQDASFANITSSYSLYGGILTVPDGGGNLVSYKTYMLALSVPYSSNHRHNIIIS